MTSSYARRRWTAATLAAVTAFTVVGCAAGDNGGSADGEEISLRFTWWGSDARHEKTLEAIALFEEQNPGVTIVPEYSGWDGYWDALSTKAAANDLPDIMQQVDPYIFDYAQNGTLADLTEYSDVLDLEPFSPAIMEMSTVDGAVYGVPGGMTGMSAWVNPATIESVGIDLPDDQAWSWEDYAEYAASITSASGGSVVGSGQVTFDSQMFNIWARQQGEQVFSETGVGFEPETLSSWWEFVLEMQQDGSIPTAEQSVEAVGKSLEESGFATGQTAIQGGWASQIGAVQAVVDTPLALMQLPGESEAEVRGVFVKPSLHYSVAASSEHPEEAAKFVDFLVNTVDAGEILGADRGTPANPEVLEELLPSMTEGDQLAAEYLLEANELVETGLPIPPPGASVFEEAFIRYSQEVVFGRMTPAEAADALIAEVDTAVA